jgi:hypothetical protein
MRRSLWDLLPGSDNGVAAVLLVQIILPKRKTSRRETGIRHWVGRLADLAIPEGLVQAVQGKELYFWLFTVAGAAVDWLFECQISCIYEKQNSLAIYVCSKAQQVEDKRYLIHQSSPSISIYLINVHMLYRVYKKTQPLNIQDINILGPWDFKVTSIVRLGGLGA